MIMIRIRLGLSVLWLGRQVLPRSGSDGSVASALSSRIGFGTTTYSWLGLPVLLSIKL